jgi:hypothetical protein
MNDAELLERADCNYIEFNRESARSTAGGVVHEEDGLVFFAPGHRFPVGFTGVIRTDRRVTAADTVARAKEWFLGRGLGFTFAVMEHRDADIVALLEEAGVSRFGNMPGMLLDAPLAEKPLAPGISVERVTSEAQAREFADISGAAYATYGMPPKIAREQFADAAFFRQTHVAAFLARIGDAASAAAMTMVSHEVAGVYWVGTTPEARGRGLAELCTRRAGNAGFEMGAKVAALQASVMGEPIYKRMGYREVTHYPWYVLMP